MILIILLLFLTATSCTSTKSNVGEIESLIEYRYDRSMFTVFSWMSVGKSLTDTAIVEDNLKLSVIKKICEKLTDAEKASLRDYYKVLSDKYEWMFDYVATIFALNCYDPPGMRPKIAELREYGIAVGKMDKWTLSKLEELSPLADTLNIFYHRVALADIMDEVEDSYQQVIESYKTNAATAILGSLNYCRVSIADIPSAEKIVVIPNLLGPVAEMGPEFMGVKYDVKGPGSSTTYSAHEFIHSIVHPVVSDSTITDIINQIVRALPDTVFSSPAWKSYSDPVIYFEECMVRSIDSRLTGRDIGLEVKKGFLLCGKMCLLLADMEKEGTSFTDFFPHVLEQLHETGTSLGN